MEMRNPTMATTSMLAALMLTACVGTGEGNNREPNSMGNGRESEWVMEVGGKKTDLYTLRNKNGIEITITNYGGKIVSLNVPDKNGEFADIVLGYDNIRETVSGYRYFGALIGRYGNRIAKGRFSIDGVEYTLATNNGENALHGGIVGYNHVMWNAVQDGNKLTLKHA